MASPGHRDPRSIVTPDAFEVSPDLIGTPLARPNRRAVALAIDGLVIVALTALTKSFSLILGVIAAGLFMRAGFRRTPVRGSVFGRAMRISVGCLGLIIAVVTAALWASFGIGFDREGAREEAARAITVGTGQVLQGLGAAVALEDLEQARSPRDALAVAERVMPVVRDLGLPDDVIREALLAGVPESAQWRGEWEALVDSLVAGAETEAAAGRRADATESAASSGSAGVRAQVDAYSESEALREYAALSADSAASGTAGLRLQLLRERVFAAVAGDSVEALRGRSARLERQSARLEADLEEARQELEAANSRGIVRRVLDLGEDLGFGFGWAAVYMTVVLAWWNGQTVGKRLMRIRVVRLDGGAITWWVAFERVGGYAAGLATGLLGFAQVWWDANRQAIHDRIVGTVVVQDGAEKVVDWESAL
jgi:uncharacterized RDD family membrane protein YckC